LPTVLTVANADSASHDDNEGKVPRHAFERFAPKRSTMKKVPGVEIRDVEIRDFYGGSSNESESPRCGECDV
jgi:hypothetical protein